MKKLSVSTVLIASLFGTSAWADEMTVEMPRGGKPYVFAKAGTSFADVSPKQAMLDEDSFSGQIGVGTRLTKKMSLELSVGQLGKVTSTSGDAANKIEAKMDVVSLSAAYASKVSDVTEVYVKVGFGQVKTKTTGLKDSSKIAPVLALGMERSIAPNTSVFAELEYVPGAYKEDGVEINVTNLNAGLKVGF